MKLKSWFIICACIPFLTSCWDRTEVNDLAFVIATGFDKLEENSFRTSVQVPLPGNMGGTGGGGGGTGGNQPYYVDSGVGRNIRESNDELQQRMSRQLYFAHRRIIVIGNELAKAGFKRSLNVILDQPQSRISSYVLISEGEAMDVLNASPHLEKLPAEAIREMAKASLGITVEDVLNDIYRPGKDPVVPIVSIAKTKNKGGDEKEEIELKNVALLKDDKLMFIANEKETSAVNWLRDQMVRQNFTFPIDEKSELNVKILQSRTDTKYTIKNDVPSFTLTLNVEAKVMQNEPELDMFDQEVYDMATEKMEHEIKDRIDTVLSHAKSEGIDFYGFGWILYRYENHLWEKHWQDRWDTVIKDVDIKVNVNAEIERTINTGLQVQEG